MWRACIRERGNVGIARGRGQRAGVAASMLLGAVAIGGCGAQSTLDTHSRPAREIADLWWWMLAAAVVVLLGAIALLAVGWRQRHHAGLIGLGRLERHTTGLVVTFGILVPLIVVTAVFAIANFSVASVTNAPAVGSTSMTIDVTGHQWFWEVRYPGRGVVTANEIHIPVGTRINAVLRTADVIHSFWVPSLNRKADMIPGYPNRILLYADKPGVYRGQCAEFCGIEHANMATTVIAESAARFKAWLAHNAQPAASPVTPQQRAGLRVFEASSCASCHTIAGTPAHGEIGPDLTHVGGRTTLAALTIPNTPAQMRDWILHPQRIKPGNRMPDLALTAPDADALVAYLESLR